MNTTTFRRILFFFAFSTPFLLVSNLPEALTYPLSGGGAQTSDKQARADEIIAKVRKATYGEIDVASVKRLSIGSKTRHQRANDVQDTGESVLDLEMPDKMLVRSTRDLTDLGQVNTCKVLNGDQSWSDLKTSSSKIPVIRTGGKSSNDDRAKHLQAMRREQAIALMRLALPPARSFPLTYAFAGEAKATDGEAYVIDVTGPDAFSARLFVDKTKFRIIMAALPDTGGDVRMTPGRGPERLPRAGAKITLRFYDFKPESGVTLPHRIKYEQADRIVTEYELKNFQLNPEFPPDHFDVHKWSGAKTGKR